MPFQQCPNYEENIQASITLTEMTLGSLRELKGEQAKAFKAELEMIYSDMKRLSVYESLSKYHMVVFESFPILIGRFSKALNGYFSTIKTLEEVEHHRKLFSPILNKIEKISCSFSVSSELPDYIKHKLSINSINKIRAEFNAIFNNFAKQFPINEDDIFTGEEIIPVKRRITFSSGHQFDLIKLLQWQCTRPVRYQLGELPYKIKYINPFTNSPLTSNELRALKIVAMHLGMSLHITLEDNPQKLKEICDQYLLKEQIFEYWQEKNYPKIREILLDGDAKKIKNQALADSALDQAVSNGDVALIDYLLKLGVSPNPSHHSYPPLINAAGKNHVETGVMLLSAGANVNAYAYNSTALYFATKSEGDDTAFIKLLLDHKVDVNQKLDANRTALYEAVWHGKVNRAKLLLSAGSKIDVVYSDFGGIPMAHAAIYSKNLEMIKLMKESGVNFSEKNGSGKTPLQLARALKLTPEIIDFLECEETMSCLPVASVSSMGFYAHSQSQSSPMEVCFEAISQRKPQSD